VDPTTEQALAAEGRSVPAALSDHGHHAATVRDLPISEAAMRRRRRASEPFRQLCGRAIPVSNTTTIASRRAIIDGPTVLPEIELMHAGGFGATAAGCSVQNDDFLDSSSERATMTDRLVDAQGGR